MKLPLWLRGNVLVLSVTQTIFVSANTLWIVFFPLWLSFLGVDDIGIGLIFTVGTTTSALSIFAGGRLADVHGRRKVTVIGSLIYTPSILFILFLKNVLGSTLGYLTYCLGTGLAAPAITVMLMESSPQGTRGTSYAFASRVLPSLPPALLAPLGGYLFDKKMYGFSLLIAFFSFIFVTLIYLVFLKETLLKNEGIKTFTHKRSSFNVLDKFLILIITAFGIDILTTRGINWYVPLFLKKFGYSAFRYGILISASTIAITIGSFVSGKLTDRIGPVRTATIDWILVAIVIYLFAFMSSCFTVAVLLYAVWKFVGMISYAAPALLINDHYDQKKRSTAMGVYTSLTRLVTLIGPPLTTYALFFGSRTPFIFKSILALVSITTLHIAVRLEKQK